MKAAHVSVSVPAPGPGSVPGPGAFPVLWINCQTSPFLDDIGALLKIYETRNGRNVLQALVGKRVILAETGHDRHLARYTAVIRYAVPVRSRALWNLLRPFHRVPVGNPYDWTPETRVKWLYRLTDVKPLPVPVTVSNYQNIGRSWAMMKEE